MPIQLVGVTSAKQAGTNTTMSVPLNALTGGIGTAVATGDFIVCYTGFADTATGTPGITTPTATQIAVQYANGTTNDTVARLGYFFAASAITSLTVTARGSNTTGTIAVVAVFRNVDTTTPMDATPTTATGTTLVGDAPAITPVSNGALVIAALMCASTTGGTWPTPTGFTALVTDFGTGGSTRNVSAGLFYKENVVGAIDPAAVTNPGTGTGNSFAAATLALRPVSFGKIKAYTGAAFIAKPVKVWNGSAWVTKTLKVWNGSAWVPTNY